MHDLLFSHTFVYCMYSLLKHNSPHPTKRTHTLDKPHIFKKKLLLIFLLFFLHTYISANNKTWLPFY